jgi:hypothetical protein
MKNRMKVFLSLAVLITLGACNNFFHELIPPDGNRIVSFRVEGQMGEAVIGENTITADIGIEADITSLVPVVKASAKADVFPITFDYIHAAFPSVDIYNETKNLAMAGNLTDYVIDLIKKNPDFNIPAINMPVDFSGPVDFIVISAQGAIRLYKATIKVDSGDPKFEGFSFAKYDNPELVKDAPGIINERSRTISVFVSYPMEMAYLSYALIPSFEIIGDRIEADGSEIISGQTEIQFTMTLGSQNKTITVWRNGQTTDYTLLIKFTEDPDTIRSITDFRFNKMNNSGIAANAVASIINTDNTGVINIQVFYTGVQPTFLIPRFITPGTVSVNGVQQTTGVDSRDFSSSLEYYVVSRNGQYTRTYTVKTEFISLTDAAPRFLSFRFARNVNLDLVQDTAADISDGLIMIDAHYGGSFPPDSLIPEFTAQGLVSVLNSVQISGSSGQNFIRQIKYTVTNPINPLLKRDYWVQTRMLRDTSSDARMDSFGFYPEDNPGLPDVIIGKVDQITGRIIMYAPVGSGVSAQLLIPRFTGVGLVNVGGITQISGVSGRIFDSPVTYNVVSANGINRREYTVELKELTSRIHVNLNAFGNSDGTSWQNAFRSLQAACDASFEFPDDIPVEIWIAAGTYTPAGVTDYFPLAANTSYIGGFAGYETAKSQRNTAVNVTTISGNLSTGVYARRLFSSDVVINGDLLFENLHFTSVRGTSGSGAGINAQLNAASEVSLTYCNINDVNAAAGGALFYTRGGGIVISDCVFTSCTGNMADVQGITARISDVDFTGCPLGALNCSGDTEIKQVNISDYSGTAIMLSGSGNKTLKTINFNRGAAALNVSNSMGILLIESLTMQNITGTGIVLTNVNGVKRFSGVTGNNINAGAITCNTNSGSFSLLDSNFDHTGAVIVNCGSATILDTTIKNLNLTAVSALDITGSANIIIDGITIDNVPDGRGININNTGVTDISNAVIKNCVSSGNGGGINITGSGSANFLNTTITGCKANSYGGGTYLSCSGEVFVSGVTIDGCSLTASTNYGGGIYRSTGSLKIENSVIKNITGSDSTGVYHNASADLIVSVLELQNIPYYGIYNSGGGVKNLSGITASNIVYSGVYSTSMTSGSFTVADSTFNGCNVYCTAEGNVPVKITDTDIKNVPDSQGLYLSSEGVITVNWVTIDDVPNKSGIFLIANGSAVVSNTVIKNCVTPLDGGGIIINGSGSANISNTSITGCKANNFGGGMDLTCSGEVFVSGVTIDGCGLTGWRGCGGGIYRSNGSLKIENSVIKNLTGSYSRGVYHDASADLIVSVLELHNIPYYGIYIPECGVINLSGITASNIVNSGVYSNSTFTSRSFTLADSTFNGCNVYFFTRQYAPVKITDTDIKNVSGNGIGLEVKSYGAITIDRVNIDGVPNGRGMYVDAVGTIKIINSAIRNCKTSGGGGGIYCITNGVVEISDTTIENCEAGIGGGVYISDYYSQRNNVITGSKFINCTAADDYKILYAGRFASISNCEFTHNASLPVIARTTSNVVSLFGNGGNFENCTFNNLKGNMPAGQNFLFNRWEIYIPEYGGSGNGTLKGEGGDLVLKNCTFNFNSGSAGLLALFGGQQGGGYVTIPPDYLHMDGNTINDTGGQSPLIWLNNSTGSTAGTFRIKANNVYNTPAVSITIGNALDLLGLVNGNVIRLVNGAMPVLVP